MLYSIGLVLVLGIIGSVLFKHAKLPSLLGMLVVGMLIGPYGFGLISHSLLSISNELRQVALVVILTRAGLGIDLRVIKKLGLSAALMCFLPAVFEIFAVTFLSHWIFGFSYLDGMILGSVLGAVSPAIIVPRMLNLMEKKDVNQDIVQLVLTGASLDDVFVLVIFSSLISIRLTGQFDALQVLNIPVSIFTGVLIGCFVGIVMTKIMTTINLGKIERMLMLLGMSLILLGVEKMMPFAFSAMVAIIALSMVVVALAPNYQETLIVQYRHVWGAAEIWLFVLVGCLLDYRLVLAYGLLAGLLIFGALVIRMMGVFISISFTKLTNKQKIYTMMAYIPKATVQAAIGAIPLSLGLEKGSMILVLSVTAILITAPLGAFLMDRFWYLAKK